MSENNMWSNFTGISDYQLDELVRELQLRFPNSGQVMLMGHLRSRGVIVPRHHLRDSIVRIDPLSSQLRWRDAVQRRTYSVPHANSLWHIDGHHKLIRWKFVVHGGIDGFSRLIVYLSCSTNNKSSTVLSLFLEAVQTYGIPSRVRSDKGGENIQVCHFMISFNLEACTDRNSHIATHNQRIERLWRDVYLCVCSTYHNLFYGHRCIRRG